jgi:hypothetical protein
MDNHYSGPASAVTGLETHSISECAVFFAAERIGVGHWGQVYFAHVQGGDWSGTYAWHDRETALSTTRALVSFAGYVNRSNCFSIIVAPSATGYERFGELPQSLGFPADQLSVYISNTSGDLGFAVQVRYGWQFGEIDDPIAKDNPSMPYGRRVTPPSFTNWGSQY